MKRPSLLTVLYNVFFWILWLALVGLIVITPIDLIIQVSKRRRSPQQTANWLVIAGGYGATIFLAIVFVVLRTIMSKQDLKKIPKAWIPVEKGEVKKKVRKMIVASLNRSAVIAWDSRPRISTEPPVIVSDPENREAIVEPVDQITEREKRAKHGLFRRVRSQMEPEEHTVTIPPPAPVWGEISHDGWSSPTSPDLPDLQFITVILELPHLIEARAVSLAPADPESTTEPPLPDIQAVDLLQRPAAMGLREYIGHLVSVGVINSSSTAAAFLTEYEYARFSEQPLSEPKFRELMKHFADLLRTMEALSPAILTSLNIEGSEGELDGASSLTPATPRSRSLASSHSTTSYSGSEGTIRTGPTRSIGTNGTPSKRQEFSTAPATPRSKKRMVSRSPSMHSFAQSRRPYDASNGSSSSSLRSTSQSSVIRLSNTHEDGYTLTIPAAR